MRVVELIAWALGLGAGLLAGWLSAAASIRLGDGGFWRQAAAASRLLLSADNESQLWGEYFRLWPALVAFLARKLAVTATGVLPIAAGVAFLWMLAGPAPVAPAATGWEFHYTVAVCAGAIPGVLLGSRKP